MSENIDINIAVIKEEVSINAANHLIQVNINTAPISIINPQNYDLSQFTNTSPNPFVQQSTLGGYVPSSRIININGVAQDLSSDRAWTIATNLLVGTTPISSGTVGRVLFEGTGNVLQQSSSLFWDNTNELLQLTTSNTASALRGLSVSQFGNFIGGAPIRFDKARGTTSTPLDVNALDLVGAFTFNARVGGTYTQDRALFGANMATSTGIGVFIMGGTSNASFNPGIYVHPSNNVTIGSNQSIISGITDAGYKLDVNGTFRASDSLIASSSGGGAYKLTVQQTGVGNGNTFRVIQLGYTMLDVNASGVNFMPFPSASGTVGITNWTSTGGSGLTFFTKNSEFTPQGGAQAIPLIKFPNPSAPIVMGATATVDLRAYLTVSGGFSATSGLAAGQQILSTLTANASNDVLVGLDINPSFTVNTALVNTITSLRINTNYNPGSWSGNNNQYGIDISPTFRDSNVAIGLKLNPNFINISNNGAWAISVENTGYGAIRQTSSATPNIFTGVTTIGNNVVGHSSFHLNVAGSGIKVGTPNTTGQHLIITHSEGGATLTSIRNQFTAAGAQMLIDVGGQGNLRLFGTGNVTINSATDAGFKLDVNGTARVQTSLEIAGTTGLTLGGGVSTLAYAGSVLNIGNSASWTDVRLFAGGVQKFSQTSSLTTIANTTINLSTTTVQLAGVNALTYSGTDIRIGSVAAGFNSLSMYVAGSERARIASTGNLLINTTTDAGFRLDVNGTARVSGNLTVASGSNFVLAGSANAFVSPSFALWGGGTGVINVSNGGYGVLSRLNFGANASTSIPALAINTNELIVRDANNGVATSFGVGVSSTMNASAKMQIDATDRGFLPPRMTTTQRNAIASPAAGLMVYDTTLNAMFYFNGTIWI
jgi:hypothetical protein